MHEVTVLAKVKSADMRYTQQGKAVMNIKFGDWKKDKQGKWHGANYVIAYWGEYAEKAAEHIKEGKVYLFKGEVDDIQTFELKDGGLGKTILLSTFTKYFFLPGSMDISNAVPEGGVISEGDTSSEAMGFGSE